VYTHLTKKTTALIAVLSVAAMAAVITSCGDDDGTGPGCDTCLVVSNTSPFAVDMVNYRDCGAASWGADRLSGEIAAGQSGEFAVTAGCYDVRAANVGGSCTISFFGRDIADGARYTVDYDGCM
jgi:hypothetical protein